MMLVFTLVQACFGQFKKNEPIELPENIALLGKEYTEEEIETVLKEMELTMKDTMTLKNCVSLLQSN